MQKLRKRMLRGKSERLFSIFSTQQYSHSIAHTQG